MGKLSDVQLKAWVRDGARIAGKSDGEGLTFTLSARGTSQCMTYAEHLAV
jgi:hypothetical protein